MTTPSPLAQELNHQIEEDSPACFSLLSNKGRSAFFPKMGIFGQTADAKGTAINATVGMALEEDGSPMRFEFLDAQLDLIPQETFPYASSYGITPLREKWKEMMLEKNPNLRSLCSLPVVTCGLTHGLSIAGQMLLDPEDTLIVSDMFWGNYKLIFTQETGAAIKTYNTFSDGGLDLVSLQNALIEGSPCKRILVLNFPNNPSGYVPTREEASEIISIIEESASGGNCLGIIVDDAYFGQCYEDGLHEESFFSALANLHENVFAIKIDGPTKEDYVWGFRTGFITFASKNLTEASLQALESKAAGLVRGTISNVSHPAQSLLLKLYQRPDYEQMKQEKLDLLKKRYQEVQKIVNKEEYRELFTPVPFNSGYFMCVRLADGIDADTVRKELIADYSTGLIAIGSSYIRIAFSAAPTSDLETLFENLATVCSTHSPLSHATAATIS